MTNKEKKEYEKQLLDQLDQTKKNSDFDSYKKYIGLDIKDWPKFKIDWDHDPNNFYYALDSRDPNHFKNEYPKGVSLATVKLEDLDTQLNSNSRRTNEEIWDTGDTSVASSINHWVKGKKMTPPIIEVHKNGTELVISGGNHRLAVCRAINESIVTILVPNDQKKKVSKILKTLDWI